METKRCYGCMKLKQNSPVCEHCGYDERRTNGPNQLPVGTILQGKYLVGRVLGQGGFGITYLGRDIKLDIPVAIKEYYPTGMVTRESTVDCTVTVVTDGEDTRFVENRDRFLREAQTLARLEDVSEVVQVKTFFEENNTAYIVMGYVRGITLKEHMRRSGGRLPAGEVFRLLEPLMQALGQVHELGLVHRDISPDNIMLQPNGRARLIDFGAAHTATTAGDKSTQAVLKHGFAPPEQYQSKGILGPWTDVYAMCATVYHLLTGLVPPNITDLLMGEADFEWDALQGLTPGQLDALKQGLVTQYKKRIQSMDELCRRLFGEAREMPRSAPVPEPQPIPEPKPQPKQDEPSVSETGTVALIREETQEAPTAYTAPVVLEEPVFTTPVEESIITTPVEQESAYTTPVQRPESYTTPVEREDSYTAPVERAPDPPVKESAPDSDVTTESATPQNNSAGTGINKFIPIAIAVAVLLVMVLVSFLPNGSTQAEPPTMQEAYGSRILMNPEIIYTEVSDGENTWEEFCAEATYAFGTNALRKEVASITFLDTTKDAPWSAVDASEQQDGSVMAWAKSNGQFYDLYLAADGTIIAPVNCMDLFAYYSNLKSIDVSNLDTSNVTNMQGMFYNCTSLTTLDVSGFNTSNVISMSYMFYSTYNLKNVNGNFDVRKVEDYGDFMDDGDSFNGNPWKNLFQSTEPPTIQEAYGSRTLMNLPDSELVWTWVSAGEFTSRVLDEDANYAFGTKALRKEISSITFLDTTQYAPADAVDASQDQDGSVLAWVFPNKESPNLYNLYLAADGGIVLPAHCAYLFAGYSNLKELDLSCFDTRYVTDMYGMFEGCSGLTELDVSGFDTRFVYYMTSMFDGCSGLTELDVSGFDTRNVGDMAFMFARCSGLTELDVSGFDTRNVYNMNGMFYNCSSLIELDVSSFHTEYVPYMSFMFYGTDKLKNVNGNFVISDEIYDYEKFMDPGDTFNGRPWKELFQ